LAGAPGTRYDALSLFRKDSTMRALFHVWPHAAVSAVFLLFMASAASSQEAKPDPAVQAKVKALVLQLDNDEFDKRNAAEAELLKIGEPAIEQLEAAARLGSLEVRQRSDRVQKAIRARRHGLTPVSLLKHGDLQCVVKLSPSPDGKFLYAAGWKSNSIVAFKFNAATGTLEHLQSHIDPENLQGSVSFCLSPSGKVGVATCFRSKRLVLFTRDPETGLLERKASHDTPEFVFPIDAVFSRDGRFVYAIDDAGGTVRSVPVREDGTFVDATHVYPGEAGCLNGARGLALHPDGKTLYVVSSRGATLSVLSVDPKEGTFAVKQRLTNGDDKISTLAGAHGVCVSSDGKNVYVTSGRFHGSQAVSAYQVRDDGTLAFQQEWENDNSDLTGFVGGNHIAVSRDGELLVACGTLSQSLACFRRDPKTGQASFLTALHSPATGAGGGELGACFATWSPDGRFLFLSLEDEGAISVFRRGP
jgi:6-phosphogluconolactonase (cycloisomerase 2 family)